MTVRKLPVISVLLAALLLSTGSLADRWGRKRLFLIGLVVFMGGSLRPPTQAVKQ